ncbi:MAG: sulfatase-like hydrolase/transferase [Thermoplasmatota archaeon]
MHRPDIFLIIMDTLRKDFSVKIREMLVEEGFTDYDRAFSTASWTQPSISSIMTGHYPKHHGVHVSGDVKAYDLRLKKGSRYLPSILKENGYQNYLFSANPFVTRNFGYSDFDHYHERLPEKTIKVLNKAETQLLDRLRKEKVSTFAIVNELIKKRNFRLLIKGLINRVNNTIPMRWVYSLYRTHILGWPKDKGIRILKRTFKEIFSGNRSKGPKFVMMNFMETHEPYFKDPLIVSKVTMNDRKYTEVMTEEMKEKLVDKYREHSVHLEKELRSLLGIIKEKCDFQNSMIIFTSDHGQMLGEEDRLGHGRFLNKELINVPLLIKYPDNAEIKRMKIGSQAISLKKLYDLIISAGSGGGYSEGILYNDTIFAESYGMIFKYSPKEEIERRKVRELEKYKIFIYHKGHKGRFDVKNWKFIHISPGDDKSNPRNNEKTLKGKVLKFMNDQNIRDIARMRSIGRKDC